MAASPEPPETYRVLYVDDEDDRRTRRTAERVRQSDRLKCERVDPPKIEERELRAFFDRDTDLYLVDQDLSGLRGYLGSGLAGHIRTERSDRPIVLISRSSVSHDRLRSADTFEELHVADEFIKKGHLNGKGLSRVHALLEGLAAGYARLRQAPPGKIDLRTVIGADEDEFDAVREASPPISRGERTPFAVARWVRSTLLEYPGLVLPPLHAAVMLGLAPEAFAQEEVRARFAGAEYDGVFAPPDGRWWKGRLLRVATQICREAEESGSIRDALRRALAADGAPPLPAARCVWDGSEGADAVCAVLRAPVKVAHSLRYYPDARPSVMDPARVSFRAIRTSDDFDDGLLDSGGLRELKRIEKLDVPILDEPIVDDCL